MSETMKAWVADGKGGIDFRDVPRPTPRPDQALVRCKATTIARGEVRFLGGMPEGRVLGLDLAGIVEQSAADGSGPPVGAHVIAQTGYSGGGWGQYAVAKPAILGVVPDDLAWKDAGVLPNSGLTAFLAIGHAGLLLGKTVLITGATGSVGRIAAQLAVLSGAEVTGTVRTKERASAISSIGLAHVAVGNEAEGPFDLVVDMLGGGALSYALKVVAEDGVVVTIGGGEGFDAPEEQAVVPHGWFGGKPAARLIAENVGFRVIQGIDVAKKLSILGRLAASGKLDLDSSRAESWTAIPDAVERLRSGAERDTIGFLID